MWNISFNIFSFNELSFKEKAVKGSLSKALASAVSDSLPALLLDLLLKLRLKLRQSFLLFPLGFLLFFGLFSCSAAKDYLLVIDTSGSMSAGERVIDKVKESLPAFMESVEGGDTITLVTFDGQTQVGMTYAIDDQEDREQFILQVKQLEARGAYTDMKAMILAIKELSESMRQAGRELYIVVMSDGLDDPPPWKEKRGPIALENLQAKSSPVAVEQPYIYYLSLGILKDRQLEERLSQLSGQVTTLDNPSQILGEVTEDIESREKQSFLSFLYLFLALLTLAAFVIYSIYRLYRFLNRHRFQGQLLYYDEISGPYLKDRYELGKLKKNRMLFGSRPGANLKIAEMAFRGNISLKAAGWKGESCLKPQRKALKHFRFDSQQRKNVISKGDKFQVSNIFFEYTDGDQG